MTNNERLPLLDSFEAKINENPDSPTLVLGSFPTDQEIAAVLCLASDLLFEPESFQEYERLEWAKRVQALGWFFEKSKKG